MDLLYRLFPIVLLVASTLAHFEDFGSFEGHGFEGYQHQPVSHQQHQSLDEHHGEEYDLDYHAHPKYSFDYSVKDPHTGDDKEHWETRDGDKVKGSYTLIETDGTKRIVEYEADDKNGFNAVVHKIGTPKHEEYHAKPAHEPAQYQQEYGHFDEGHEEYHAKPAHEPARYQQEYGHFDEGFVPMSGGYSH